MKDLPGSDGRRPASLGGPGSGGPASGGQASRGPGSGGPGSGGPGSGGEASGGQASRGPGALGPDRYGPDRYGSDVLAGFSRRASVAPPRQPAERGLVVEVPEAGFVGAVVRVEAGAVHLEDRHGRVRAFPLGTGFLLEGRPVTLVPPSRRDVQPGPGDRSQLGRIGEAGPPGGGRARTASGSFAVAGARARVALPSRILVEGRHDAELVERVWGDDLRVEGVVVELLNGVEELPVVVAELAPTAQRRLGVLVDHLVPGSKESRIADAVARSPHGRFVRVVGHPFVDIWQAVRPERLGIAAWPVVPRELEWKRGVCRALGWPHESAADVARAWARILGRVRGFADLEPALLGRVEELIDFVTVGSVTVGSSPAAARSGDAP
ncbi:MAG: DUF3097 family protein [Microbacteriaceae bacterium]